MRFLQWAFLIGCCLLALILFGPWVLLGLLAVAGLGMVIREHWERLERRGGRKDPRDS